MPNGTEAPKTRPYKRVSDTTKYQDFFTLTRTDETVPTSEEAQFVQYLTGALKWIDDDRSGDASNLEVLSERDNSAKQLAKLADQFIEGRNALWLHEQAAQEVGKFFGLRERLTTLPHVVRDEDSGRFDVNFAGADLTPDSDQQKLLVDLEKTRAVIRVVFKERELTWFERLLTAIRSPFMMAAADREERSERGRYKYYLERLAELARAGLGKPPKVDYARLQLQALQDEFVSYEADIVKNRYVETLGLHAMLYGVPLFCLYWLVRYQTPSAKNNIDLGSLEAVIHRNQEFFLLAAGACVGTWLSFSIRRVVLGFADLALLEDDRLRPTARILFVIGLTMVVGMLLQTHLVGFTIGGTEVALNKSGLLALLIGVLCGISERAMSTAVSRRAEEFSQRIGGETRKT